jgi:golgi phosphoprotein 3
VTLRDSDTSGNSIVSEISRTIRDSTKPKQLKYWIGKLSKKSGVYKRAVMGELERKRQVRIEDKKFLRLIPFTRYYLINNRIRLDLIKETKEAILSRRAFSNEDFSLLGLIEACKMHKILTTDKAELKILRRELKKLIKESPIASAVNHTIQQVQAAIISAIVVSSVATRY